MTGAACTWSCPRSLPAFCSSSVMLGTVGDLRPTPSPPGPTRRQWLQPSPHSRVKLIDSSPWREEQTFLPQRSGKRPGGEMMASWKCQVPQDSMPSAASGSAHGLAPGLTLSLIESELSCLTQIYKHTLASSSGVSLLTHFSLALTLVPSGERRWGQRGGHLDLWQETLPVPKLVRLGQCCLKPSSLPRLRLPGSLHPFIDLPLPSTRLEVGSRERPFQTGSPPSFLVLFGPSRGLCTLWLWILFSPRIMSFAA